MQALLIDKKPLGVPMTLHFTPTLHAASLLLSAALLAACGSKLSEPMKVVVPLYTPPTSLVSTPAPSTTQEYGVPEASRVEFKPDAQTAVQDLTY
jgi:hypothetical protein